MRLTKHHGLGNDFLVALVDDVPDDGADLARAWCHRTRGIGADGLIFGTPGRTTDVTMTLFNADGSGAEISGNGIRCLAQAVFERDGASTLRIDTPGGIRRVDLVSSGGATAQIAVDMGPVGDGPPMVPMEELSRPTFSVVRAATGDVGNPHVVIEIDDLAAVDPVIDGPAVEALWKPEGINVHFMTGLGSDSIALVHWERGSGATEACGSGATVAATVAHRWGLVGDRVQVSMPGGTAEVLVGASAQLVGPAVHVADLEVITDG